MSSTQVEARKRIKLKRYLTRHNIDFDVNESTTQLRLKVRNHKLTFLVVKDLNSLSPQEINKRHILQNYLKRLSVDFHPDLKTSHLAEKVKRTHRERMTVKHRKHAWPMTSPEIEDFSSEDHYVHQLVMMKVCFGLNASIGCVETPTKHRRCFSVADLVKIGWASDKFLKIDDSIENLKTLKTR